MPDYESIKPVIYKIEDIAEAFDCDSNSVIFNHVDNIVIQFGTLFIHFGQICYIEFKKKQQGDNRKLKVIKTSLDKRKVVLARGLIHYSCDLFIDGIRSLTIHNRVNEIKKFINSLNESELALNESSLGNILINHSDFLKHKIKIYDKELGLGITSATAHNQQTWIIDFFSFLLKVEKTNLLDEIYHIVENSKEKIKTKSLSCNELMDNFNAYIKIFRYFSSVVLDHKKFPLKFSINGEEYWFTISGKIIHKNDKRLNSSGCFNYNNEKYCSVDELISLKRFKTLDRKRIKNVYIKYAKNSQELANECYSHSRLFLIKCAARAYFMIFLFLTGENDSTAATLQYENEYSLCNGEQDFKSIKWRANGFEVKYDIQNEFIDDFKIFLCLREHLLQYFSQEYRSLFFEIMKGELVNAHSDGRYSSYIRKSFCSLFKENVFIGTSKRIRLTKSLWIRHNHSADVSSYILQHSNKTSDFNYSGSDFEQSSEELIDYFSEITEQLLPNSGTELETPSGNCIEPKTPTALSTLVTSNLFTVDCGDQKTCLFCSKYRILADEVDIRKLLSIKYLLVNSAHLASSIEHFNKVYNPILDRIEELLEKIREQGDEFAPLILEVSEQVFEQEKLSEYWYRKLEYLEELGVL